MARSSPKKSSVSKYAKASHEPLAGHLVLMAAFGFGAGCLALLCKRRLPIDHRVDWSDLLLLGIATHKVARIISKDRITAPLRAPFVRYERSSGSGEVEEAAHGEGVRKSVGQLLTCPYCLAPWVAGGMSALYILSRRLARVFGRVFAVVTISDFLQELYSRAKDKQ